MTNKYIIFKTGGLETPILFPETMTHSDVARQLMADPISAGFWTVRNKEDQESTFEAFGMSVTLNLKSRDEDSDILNKFFNPYYG